SEGDRPPRPPERPRPVARPPPHLPGDAPALDQLHAKGRPAPHLRHLRSPPPPALASVLDARCSRTPRSRWPSARPPRVRMTATISSTVGGDVGYCSPLLRGGRPRW